MVGDDGQGLLGGPGQPSRFLPFDGHQEGEIRRCLETPPVGNADQLDTASCIPGAKVGYRPLHVGALGQSTCDVVETEGTGRSEQEGLDPALGLRRLRRFGKVLVEAHPRPPGRVRR